MGKHTSEELRQWQALPLGIKIRMTQQRIRDWVNEYGMDGVYISFSGGKDSTVLSHIVDELYPGNDIPRVFIDTGLEYPEIRDFVKRDGRSVFIKPKMNFKKVIENYGYPMVSKEVSETIYNAKLYIGSIETDKRKKPYREFYEKVKGVGAFAKGRARENYSQAKWQFLTREDAPRVSHLCCKIMKKEPIHDFSKKTGRCAITAEMAAESRRRRTVWILHGCNMYDAKSPKSTPMAFWTEQDVLLYIKKYNVEICSVYGNVIPDEQRSEQVPGQMKLNVDGTTEETECLLKTTGCRRTGCMFCGFGCHLDREGEGRFERMKKTHPKQYEWIMKPWNEGGLGYKEVIDWLNENGGLNIKY